MLRYEFIRRFYWILRILADCYFMLINAIFGIYNAFQPAKCVQWAKEEDEAQKLLFIPANKAAKMIREKKLSSKQLIRAYIERIKAVDPLINAIRENNFDEALKQAEECDAQLAKMNDAQLADLAQKKPLFGVPFTSKDNLRTKGFKISACNYNLAKTAQKCEKDAPIVERVRSAGAILLGTTTMPNLGLSWACDDSDCGIANNPHDTRRIPGGSSSGEGALISAAGSLFGIGNDIGGSIRIPAHMCGIFGLKPTNFPDHTVPVEGIVPNFLEYKPAGEMLSNGPLVRYAEDLPLVLSIIANKPLSEYDKPVDFKKDVKIFYIEELDILISERLHPEQREVGRKVKSYFELKYDLQVQKVDFPLMNRLFEFWGLTGWSAGVVGFPEMFSQFWQLQAGKSDHTFFKWNYDVLKHFVHPKSDEEAEFVSGKLEKLRHQLKELLGQNGVLLMPAWPTPPPFHHMEPFETFNLRYTQMFNMLGFPALTVPIGKSANTKMPLGIQLAAAPFNEALLISMGKELEKAFGGWVVPGKVPKKLLETQLQ